MVLKSIRLAVLFLRNTFGCVNSPYVTYRRLAARTSLFQTVFIFALVFAYFAFASAVRTGISNPYLLTLKFNSLILGWGIGFLGIITALYVLGRMAGSIVSFKTLFFLWSYTLLPTLVWFFLTSLMYLAFPPPRTLSMMGKLYSVLFISFSIGLLLWKIILYYLTLRFGAKLDLWRISLISAVLSPLIVGYSILMYRFGIFRIPFL